VTLVEDSEINTLIAQKQGIECCLVTANNSSRFMEDVMQMVQYKEQGFLSEIELCSSPSSLIGSQEYLYTNVNILSKRALIPLPTQELEEASNNHPNSFTPKNINSFLETKTTINFPFNNSFKDDRDEESNQLNKRGSVLLPSQEEIEVKPIENNVSPIAQSTADLLFEFDDDTVFSNVVGKNSLDFV